ncbi:MAG: hypothetical protein JW984_01555 [Deltaproteobacteria bacterium]|uniref:Uncharacterized protein n=1 Tax=Candidatus Zymogenus saltonus TaxID=2844893 RepID=A0A9D8PJ13_9DELT|nr:hypothetical protein [Candidatus Zymogenus saltonus]
MGNIFKDNYGGDKYGAEIQLDKIGKEVIIGLAMDDEEIIKIGRGDSVEFSGKLINFKNFGYGVGKIYLYNGRLKKK